MTLALTYNMLRLNTALELANRKACYLLSSAAIHNSEIQQTSNRRKSLCTTTHAMTDHIPEICQTGNSINKAVWEKVTIVIKFQTFCQK